MYTIISALCFVISEKHLPKSLWDKIASIVVYVWNGCPSVEGKTPFEKCNNQLPDVLGCRAWVFIPNTIKRTIIDLYAWQKIMVSYETASQ